MLEWIFARADTDCRMCTEPHPGCVFLDTSIGLLRAISDTTGDMIFAKDAQGRLTFANPATLVLIGRPESEVIGKTDAEFLCDKAAAAQVMANDRRIMETGEPEDLEEVVPLPDGTVRVWSSRKIPHKNRDGQVIGLFGVSRDITIRKEAEEAIIASERAAKELAEALATERGKLAAIIEHLPVGVVVGDPHGHIISMNLRGLQLHGFPSESEMFYTLDQYLAEFELFYPDGTVMSTLEWPVSRAIRGEFVRGFEVRLINKKRGLDIVVSYDTAPVNGPDRKPNLFVYVMRDLTQQKRNEEQIQQAREAAETANKAKDHLLAVVSHELRTPLNPILAITSYLQTQDLPPQLIDDINTIKRNVEQEARIVDDLLNVTRLGRGKIILHQEAMDLHTLIRTVVGQFQPVMESKGIELLVSLRAKPHVWVDPGRIQQVFSNLLDNAVKFTPKDGRITVRSMMATEGRVRVEITDTGIGIDPEILPKLFTPFEQGEKTTTRRFGGLGLGLVIVKGIVDLHGGTIAATSPGKDQGTTFTIELAVASGEIPHQPLSIEKEANVACQRILLVEDHPDTLRIMARLLTSSGHHVLTAADFKEAMAKIDSEDFDILVSDIGLPDGSGLDIMKALRGKRSVKGIALSGFGHDDDIRRSKEAGFTEHLVKPVDFHVLNRAIKKLA